MKPCWQLNTEEPIRQFLPAAAAELNGYNTVCLEHSGTHKEAKALYATYPSEKDFIPKRDTIIPRTKLYYCHLNSAFSKDLVSLAAKHNLQELLWHIRGYDETRLIFYSHDASDGADVLLSPYIPDETVLRIAKHMGCKPTKTETLIDWDKNQLKEKRTMRSSESR